MSDAQQTNPSPNGPAAGLPQRVQDDRPPSLGLGRIVMALFWALGAWLTVVAVIDLFEHEDEPWGPSIVALLAGIVYLLAALGLTHNGRRMRILGWACIGTSLGAPLVLGIAGLGLPELSAARSAWTGFGEDFHFLPLLVSLIGVVWMWMSNPRRIVEIAEQVERPSKRR